MATERSDSTWHSLIFAALVCIVCSVLVSGSVVLLRPRQQANVELDRKARVLVVAGLIEPDARPSAQMVRRLFRERIEPRYVELRSGRLVEPPPEARDVSRAVKDEALSRAVPQNAARVLRVPRYGLVYRVQQQGKLQRLVLPIEGLGLWSTLKGYLALAPDANTVLGITFYEHGETPGLGGEVDDPRWQLAWQGRRVFDETGQVRLKVIKGSAGSPAGNPHRVDGLSGATLTGDGVSHMIEFWLGPEGYGPFLRSLGKSGGSS